MLYIHLYTYIYFFNTIIYIYNIYIDLPTGLDEDAALKKALEASVLESAPPRWNSETSGLAIETATTSGVGAMAMGMGWSPFPALSCSLPPPPPFPPPDESYMTCMRHTGKGVIKGFFPG